MHRKQTWARRRTALGFTLIELMIAVAVMGILMAIAFPGYQAHVRKGRRADAESALLETARKMEVFYARNATYTTDMTGLGFADAEVNDVAVGSSAPYYEVRVVPETPECPITMCYVLTATAKGDSDQVHDSYSAFSLGSTGLKQKKQGDTWSNGWTN